MSNILSVENLSLSIDKQRLLNNINFEIKQGEIFALVGESGCGKSLTSLAIMRLLPDVISVSSGDIKLKNASLFSLPEYKMQKIRGKSIAMIFQEPMSALNPVMTVGEQVAEVLKIHLGLKTKSDDRHCIGV
jgi:peptide/nickel transport system ATP-binding protein